MGRTVRRMLAAALVYNLLAMAQPEGHMTVAKRCLRWLRTGVARVLPLEYGAGCHFAADVAGRPCGQLGLRGLMAGPCCIYPFLRHRCLS